MSAQDRAEDPLALPRAVPVGDRGLLAAILIGGMAGTLVRLLLSELLPHAEGSWPWGTLVANVAGAALLGFVVVRFSSGAPAPSRVRALLGTGFCGALTTFSTLQRELLEMLDAGRAGLALAYVAVSLVAGLAGVLVAVRVTKEGP
ncbi:MAG: fluoride efflux transporter CrcB [Solirubrobacterales bacterium]